MIKCLYKKEKHNINLLIDDFENQEVYRMVRDYDETAAIVSERVVVCITAQHNSERLIDKAAALADGGAVQALVASDHLAMEDKVSGRRTDAALLQPGRVVVGGEKADFHAVRLVCHRKSDLRGNCAYLFLCISSQRHSGSGKLFLSQAI